MKKIDREKKRKGRKAEWIVDSGEERSVDPATKPDQCNFDICGQSDDPDLLGVHKTKSSWSCILGFCDSKTRD